MEMVPPTPAPARSTKPPVPMVRSPEKETVLPGTSFRNTASLAAVPWMVKLVAVKVLFPRTVSEI